MLIKIKAPAHSDGFVRNSNSLSKVRPKIYILTLKRKKVLKRKMNDYKRDKKMKRQTKDDEKMMVIINIPTNRIITIKKNREEIVSTSLC